MTQRDKIMDKYWLEFIAKHEGNKVWFTTKEFWAWFYKEIMRGRGVSKKLDDYL